MDILSPKQIKFISESTKKINLAHGSVRAGKTMAITFRVMQAVNDCPDSQIWFIGHTSSTIYDNVIRLILEKPPAGTPDPMCEFRKRSYWKKGDRELVFVDLQGRMKTISTVGATNAGAIGAIQGKTMSLVYCDEMTLYPPAIIEMILTRLSNPHSILFATMNPTYPSHILKTWIDKARAGDPDYYELQFYIEDNTFLGKDFIEMVKSSLSGVHYKRLYLGEWALADGAIFDFFDRSLHVVEKPPRCADYWVAGVDYGTSNAFAAILVGVHCGRQEQEAPIMWAEKEFYWDYKKRGYQKSSAEFAADMKTFLEPYSVKSIYLDPSAANFRLDLQRLGLHPVNADNDVNEGIIRTISLLKGSTRNGQLYVCSECKNLIREIESYVWHPKCLEKGEDEPLKVDDHAVDALRYALNTHKPSRFDNEEYKRRFEMQQREREQWRHPNDFGFRG
jgi:PBSX family phage terminase large subunit